MAKLNVIINGDEDNLIPAPVDNASASGVSPIVAAVATRLLRIYKLALVVSAATVLTFEDTNGVELWGPLDFTAAGTIVLDFDTKPWFEPTRGLGFQMNSTNAVSITGGVYYTQH
jgi:hypothetical protein